jgi:hypothetical protein
MTDVVDVSSIAAAASAVASAASAQKSFSSPLSHALESCGKILDTRKTVENRLVNSLTNATQDGAICFWEEGTTQLSSAESQVQSVLDRCVTRGELDELLNAVSVLKMTNVVLPSFIDGVDSVQLTLGQLRDVKTWIIPTLNALVTHLTNQATYVKRQNDDHNQRIERQLQLDLEKNKKDHEEKKKTAQELDQVPPPDEELTATLDRLKMYAEATKSVLIDPVGIRMVTSRISAFVNMINSSAEREIDAANSTEIAGEVAQFNEIRTKAFEKLKAGFESIESEPQDGFKVVSLAELGPLTQQLQHTVNSAISSLQIVSFKKGQAKQPEHPNVQFAKERLTELLHNVSRIIKYRQAFKEGMCLHFPTVHPRSGVPISVDGLVRLGYVNKEKKKPVRSREVARPSGRGRGGRRQQPPASLFQEVDVSLQEPVLEDTSFADCLNFLFEKLNAVNNQVTSVKNEHEKALKKSISDKQEARAKGSGGLKPGELDDIAKAVRSSEAKTWTEAPYIDRAIQQVAELTEKISEMQSSTRKSANASTRMAVPVPCDMIWANGQDAFYGWN